MTNTQYLFTNGNTDDAPRSDLPDLLVALAGDLRAISYTVDGVAALLGESASEALGRDQLIPALLASEGFEESGTEAERALAAVIRLWLLAVPQTIVALDEALPVVTVGGLVELGLVTVDSGLVHATVDLRPYGWDPNPDGSGGADLWVASDLAAHQQPGVLRHDHVLGIGQASTTLVQTTIRHHTERALDLGTGCGIQTFHLLHHCDHVTATDISERALAFTRFNLFLRDKFRCVYCGSNKELTFDHVIPRSHGGRTTWENVATACAPCNLRKGGRTPREAGMHVEREPIRPTSWQLQERGRGFPPNYLHETWRDWLYWDIELEE